MPLSHQHLQKYLFLANYLPGPNKFLSICVVYTTDGGLIWWPHPLQLSCSFSLIILLIMLEIFTKFSV